MPPLPPTLIFRAMRSVGAAIEFHHVPKWAYQPTLNSPLRGSR